MSQSSHAQPYARMDFITDRAGRPSDILAFLFTLQDDPGSLKTVLEVFKQQGVSLKHIESRPSKNFEWEHDFLVELAVQPADKLVSIEGDLAKIAKNVQLIGDYQPAQSEGTLVLVGDL